MLHYLKKEVALSMFAGLIMGLVSFYLFHFTLEQAIGSSLLVLILFMIILPIYGQTSFEEKVMFPMFPLKSMLCLKRNLSMSPTNLKSLK